MNAEMFEKRLLECVDRIGGVGKACEAAGITYTTLTRWKDGTSDPKMSNILAFAKAANVSLDWLITGADISMALTMPEAVSNEEYAYIPAYDIEASAGPGLFSDGAIEPSKYLAFRKRWIKARYLEVKSLSVIFTKGDSMEPTIPEDAIVVVDQSKTQPFDGKIYVIRIDERLFVKRVQLLPKGIRLISDNRFYDPIDISKNELVSNEVQICGQVIHAAYDLSI